MVRTITTSVTVYQFDELTPDAQEKAVQHVRELLTGPWWDSGDNDDIQESMVYTLAEKLGSPGWDTHGVADFPGIAGVTVESWDLDRGQHLAVSGTLTRSNAPALPWMDGIDGVELYAGRSWTDVDVAHAVPECTCPPESPWSDPHVADCASVQPSPVTGEQYTALKDAVTGALHDAWKAGYIAMEYKTSEEYAKEDIESNGREFLEDGTLAD